MPKIVTLPSRQKSQHFDSIKIPKPTFQNHNTTQRGKGEVSAANESFWAAAGSHNNNRHCTEDKGGWDSRAAWLRGSTMSLMTASVHRDPAALHVGFVLRLAARRGSCFQAEPGRTTSRRMRTVPFSSCFPASSRCPLKSQGPEQATCPLLKQSSQKG